MVQVIHQDTCPTDLALEWYVSQPATNGDATTEIETHLSSCDRCRERVDALRLDDSLLQECRHVLDVATASTITPRVGPDGLGHFTLLEEIGSGGQGVVWKALDRRTGRHVAIKVLRLGQFAPARHRQRLEREIEIVASLRHPGIVTLYESLDVAAGGKAIVMELVEGKPFDGWVASLSGTGDELSRRRRVLQVLAKVCDAVDHAHTRGVIHRDLKPSNILIDANDHPHIVDFGIAKAASASGEAATAMTTEPIGSPPYMAPEQVLEPGAAADLRSDVYALGTIIFEGLTGQRAFSHRRSVGEYAREWRADTPPPRVSAVLGSSRLSADADAVIATALAADVGRRYASVRELAHDLRALLDGGPVLARRESIGFHLRWLLRHHRRSVAAAVAAMTIALTGAGVYLFASWQHEVRQRELVDWGTSLSGLLANAELEFPAGSLGKPGVLRLEEARLVEAATRLDELLARGQLSAQEEATLSIALARVSYLAGVSLDTAEEAAARALTLRRADQHASGASIWQCGELLAAIRLRRTDGRDGIAALVALGRELEQDPRTDAALRARINQWLANVPLLQTIEQVSGTLDALEKEIRNAEAE